MLTSRPIRHSWCSPFLSVIPTKFSTKSYLPQPTRFHYPNNTSLFILRSLQLFAMQRLCVQNLHSHFTVLNIFLSALTSTSMLIDFLWVHYVSHLFITGKKRFQLRSIKFGHKISLTDRKKRCWFLQTEDKIIHWYLMSQWSRNGWWIIQRLCTGCNTCPTISFQLVHITAVSALACNVRWIYSAHTADQPVTHSILCTPTTTSITSTSAPSVFSNLHSYIKINFLL